ncbi:hypothetical protein Xcel_1607 [Xylanimonas cellulosilytica DSM 15894]|uniref:PIN domain-containing protein n=1 Tax=Xylanimonas cellulosilytica (strain DSM 15894 / JCM 12276 / CECT 5975 / KCTC 9989 / LMG 20990 / NBRC 107835 / XIL07) TaxID=446471 RepID=D1BSE0_XYLCX|nr:hypothetical protein [Xylanimonas cellulosilytica]ACZ30632.1 hypothetical protein Xcel_1607 [Xylanimonas cellulosilytica DSM 15894]
MTADDQSEPTAFLDANVLAKPFTRTLVGASAALSGYRIASSQYVEAEAQKHLGARAAPLVHDLHDVAPDAVAADYPELLYRGDRCVRCLRPLDDATGLRLGLHLACRAITKRGEK